MRDLFIGNIEGARDANNPDPCRQPSTVREVEAIGGAVETRAQKIRKERP